MTETQEPLIDVGAVTQAAFTMRSRNPDVLSCIANLSNDEVFTPPEFANQMLDTLAEGWAAANDGANIWADSTVKFLDPFTKSGVFLREITKRLVEGLAEEMPDLEDRVDHILTKQVYGIGITEITTLLARRSLYCSKWANGEHSIAKSFGDGDGFGNADGHIWFERTEHTWVDGKNWVYTADANGNQVKRFTDGRCKFCGVQQSRFDRGEDLETHAYALTHVSDPKALVHSIFGDGMQFDVVIGNPPYQMTGGAGGTSDSSIYHEFVRQAQSLEPRFLSMVIPSRWMAGGRGMGEFRKEMLASTHLMTLKDWPVSKEVFPSVEVKGGICYFLWAAHHDGDCEVTVTRGDDVAASTRQLDEFDVFIRDPRAVSVLRKVLASGEPSMVEILTADTPFGIATNFSDYASKDASGLIPLHLVKGGKREVGYIARKSIRKNEQLIDKWKVLTPKAGSDGGQKIPDSVLGKPWLSPPPAVATQTFLAFCVDTEAQARSVQAYYATKFFRFMVSLRKLTQDALRPMYTWVPQQDWDVDWTDEALYDKYNLTTEEREYIDAVIRPMELDSDD